MPKVVKRVDRKVLEYWRSKLNPRSEKYYLKKRKERRDWTLLYNRKKSITKPDNITAQNTNATNIDTPVTVTAETKPYCSFGCLISHHKKRKPKKKVSPDPRQYTMKF